MGICLDTEKNSSTQNFEDEDSWISNTPRRMQSIATPPEGQLPMHNGSKVAFESPKVPVIFILGGPGSGKVTHCDNLLHEKKGIVHINMTDLLQQYAVGNDMQDFALLSSKTVTEVMMLEMKMSPNAKTFLISGYPRNMRDVVEYSEKIQVINGAVIISWRQKILEKQIDYGAKLGQVVLSLARMELNNFFKNVMPVADYFDQSNMLIAVNGERDPAEVYKDFKAAIMKILGTQDNPPVFSHGQRPQAPADVTTELPTMITPIIEHLPEPARPKTQVISVNAQHQSNYVSPVKHGWPSVLWVIGGPGSNKAVLCDEASKETGWAHISLGQLLRASTEANDQRTTTDSKKIKECITNGDLVPFDIIMRVLDSHMGALNSADGIIIDGYPRDMMQVTEFETKFKQRPTVILLDCSKLQLGRGRLDDSVSAFRRRLEIFRQSSLPMLKALDNIGRLTIVDGDTDTVPVRQDFRSVVDQHIDYIRQIQNGEPMANGNIPHMNGYIPHKRSSIDIQKIETEPLDTVSKRVQDIRNNGIARALAHGVNQMANGVGYIGNGVKHNGPNKSINYAALDHQRRENIKSMYSEVNHM